jgi:hypothetical protein
LEERIAELEGLLEDSHARLKIAAALSHRAQGENYDLLEQRTAMALVVDAASRSECALVERFALQQAEQDERHATEMEWLAQLYEMHNVCT